jgi:hypothetical protein
MLQDWISDFLQRGTFKKEKKKEKKIDILCFNHYFFRTILRDRIASRLIYEVENSVAREDSEQKP